MKKEENHNTPFVNLSLEDCKFEIIGNSYSYQAHECFVDIFKWIDDELHKLKCKLTCTICLSTFDTTTYKDILHIFQEFDEHTKKGKEISVNWYFEEDDEDNLELVSEIKELFDIPFNIIKKQVDILDYIL